MSNFKKVKEDLSNFFSKSGIISDGIANIVPYISIISGAVIGAPDISLSGLVKAAADANKGISNILSVILDDNSPADKPLSNQKRFEITYHLLCQKSFLLATEKEFKDSTLSKFFNKLLLRKESLIDFEVKKSTAEIIKELEKEIKNLNLNPPDVIDTYAWSKRGILDGANELFENLCKTLKIFLLSKSITDKDIKDIDTICERVKNNSKIQFEFLITDHKTPYEWVYRYLIFEKLNKPPLYHDNISDNIFKIVAAVFENFKEDRNTDGNEKIWDRYRALLIDQISEPIFGSGENGLPKMGIKDLYITPSCNHYKTGQISKIKSDSKKRNEMDGFGSHFSADDDLEMNFSDAPIYENLIALLSNLVSNRTDHWDLIFLFGGPGTGKTSSMQMFASLLAKDPSMHPIYISLKKIDPTKNIIQEIEDYLRNPFLDMGSVVEGLCNCSNLVFILDGFDELAQASRELMREFFLQLEILKKRSKYRKASVIVTGRNTLFTRNDTVIIPIGSYVIEINEFDNDRIRTWSQIWSNKTNFKFNGLRFVSKTESNKELHEMAHQPFLLYLLARLEADGVFFDFKKKHISKSEIYRSIIDWSCNRQERLRGDGLGGPLTSSTMRHLLMVSGFTTFCLNKRDLHIKDLEKFISKEKPFGSIDTDVSDELRAQQTLLSFHFYTSDKQSWEFKHKSFGEYLSAEYIGFKLYESKYSASYANAHFCSKVLNFLSRGYTQISFIGTTIFPGCPPSFPRPLVCPTFVQFADL